MLYLDRFVSNLKFVPKYSDSYFLNSNHVNTIILLLYSIIYTSSDCSTCVVQEEFLQDRGSEQLYSIYSGYYTLQV